MQRRPPAALLVVAVVEIAIHPRRVGRHHDERAVGGQRALGHLEHLVGYPRGFVDHEYDVLGVEALQRLGLLRPRRTGGREGFLRYVLAVEPLRSPLELGHQVGRHLAPPHGELRPQDVRQLVPRRSRHRHLDRVIADERPQDRPRHERRLAGAVARADRHSPGLDQLTAGLPLLLGRTRP